MRNTHVSVHADTIKCVIDNWDVMQGIPAITPAEFDAKAALDSCCDELQRILDANR